MYIMIFGCILFFGAHMYAALRSRLPAKNVRLAMGNLKYMALFSIFSGIGFALMIWGYILAKPSPLLYTPPVWGSHVTLVLMLPAFILLFSSYLPLGYIKKWVGHPMLAATFWWSGSHLFANGELNSVILFGSFLVFSLIDRVIVLGRPDFIKTGPQKEPNLFADMLAVALGSVSYWVFAQYLHPILIGVPVI